MKDKFKDVPQDEGTISFKPEETKLGPYDALHEFWGMEGIAAESYILANDDIEGVKAEELEELVRTSGKWDFDSKIIVKRPEGGKYTFVNFNFEIV